MGSLFEECVAIIDQKYNELGHTLGWRFLCVSKRVLEQNPSVALITLNPGGDSIDPEHGTDSCEDGSSYQVERWGGAKPGQANLQRQVRLMFQKVVEFSTFECAGDALLEQSLIAYFVPFRSPRLNDLRSKEESFEFGEQLWKKILGEIEPRLIICIDKETHARLKPILEQATGLALSSSSSHPTGWGNYNADIDRFGSGEGVTLLRLPHLSTYKLFTSAKCQDSVDEILEKACIDL